MCSLATGPPTTRYRRPYGRLPIGSMPTHAWSIADMYAALDDIVVDYLCDVPDTLHSPLYRLNRHILPSGVVRKAPAFEQVADERLAESQCTDRGSRATIGRNKPIHALVAQSCLAGG